MKRIIKPLKNLTKIIYPEKIKDRFSKDEKRRHGLVNYITFITILTMVSYVAIYSILDFQLFRHAILFLSGSSVIAISFIIVNKKGFFNTAKLLNAIFIPFFMTYIAVFTFEKETEFHVFLLLSAIVPLFLWSFKDKIYLIIFISLNLFIYLFIEFSSPLIEPKISLPQHYIETFQSTNVLACFMGAGLAVLAYQVYANIREKQLIKQTEKLKISQSHKDIIHSVIAHDLRSPFDAFSSVTDVLINNYDDIEDEKKQEFLFEMQKSTVSIKSLLENLLEWSKLHTHFIEHKDKEFNIQPIINEIIKLFDNQLKSKNIKFNSEISDDLKVFADSHMVSTIFRNLISNAIKFSNTGGSIYIRSRFINSMVEITIEDTGIGMSTSIQENLFDIDKSITTLGTNNEKGSGLGLLLCKEFIKENGGTIRIESEPEKGSKFIFTLKTKNS